MDSARSHEAPPLGPGAVIAGCRLEEELGRGAMGVVWRARDLASGAPVALKLLQRISAERLERFQREAAAMAALEHPGIVRLLRASAGDAATPPALVMEFVPGGTLGSALREGLPLARRLQLVEQVARAIDHAHRRGVLHRDLKPENVLVGPDGQARVTDFGLARDLTRETRLTETGWLVGTPATMAPEVVRGEKCTGAPADVWALGVILYIALTGGTPFEAGSLPELMQAIEAGRFVPPSRFEPGLGPDFDLVCARALAVDPGQRQASAGRLAEDVRCLRLGLRPPSAGGRGRARKALLVGGLAALGLLAGLGALLARGGGPRAAAEPHPPLTHAPDGGDPAAATSSAQADPLDPLADPVEPLHMEPWGETSLRLLDGNGRTLLETDLRPLLTDCPYRAPLAMRVAQVGVGELDGRPGRDLVLLLVHERLYPSLVVVVDGQGGPGRHYWHPGQLGALLLADVDRDGVAEIFLGGTNNDLRGASATVPVVFQLDPLRMEGEAPPRRGRLKRGTEAWYVQLGDEPGGVGRLALEDGKLVATVGERRFRMPLTGLRKDSVEVQRR